MKIIPQTLQNRFLAGLVTILLIMGGLFSFGLYLHTKDLLLSEAREKATLMMAHTEATQTYVRKVLRPAVSGLIPQDDFVIEAMSTSYVTRQVLSTLNVAPDSFTFRRVARNARNPEYEVAGQEAVFFNAFVETPGLRRIEKLSTSEATDRLLVARPIYFSEDCLRCHGDPEDAPAVLLQTYGDDRGFHRKTGQLAGIELISVSLPDLSGTVGRSAGLFALWFGLGMLILLFFIQLFFNRLVVHNLKRVGHILQRLFFRTDESDMLAPMQQAEEIEGMIHAIETIAVHLAQTREQVDAYARNLEGMVRERTVDLEDMVKARNADVALFVRLLEELNRHNDKKKLLCTSLGLLATHFKADMVFYTCATNATDVMYWPGCRVRTCAQGGPSHVLRLGNAGSAGKEALPEGSYEHSYVKLAAMASDAPVIEGRQWLFPVKASGQNRGIIGMVWKQAGNMPPPSDISLALAFGAQFGIALDNLEAIEALLQQNTLLDSLVEGITDPLILADGNGAPLLANSSAKKLADRVVLQEGLQLPGPPPGLLLSKNQEALAGLVRYMAAEPFSATGKLPRHEQSLPDGSSFSVGFFPLPGNERLPTRGVIHIHETTEEKALLAHLRHNEKLAAVGQLAASIAHEINNPLGVIRCYAELLQKSVGSDREKADTAVILKHVDSARAVLADLLHFARPKAEKREDCHIEELLQSLVDLFRPQIAKASANVEVRISGRIPLLRTDRGMLEQVLVNLLLNALGAVCRRENRPDQGTPAEAGGILITVTPSPEQDEVSISIADNGGGMDEANLSKIFDPFFTTKPFGEGTGLGLTIAFGMVNEMGGALAVSNRYSGGRRFGARFTLTLPCIQDSHV